MKCSLWILAGLLGVFSSSASASASSPVPGEQAAVFQDVVVKITAWRLEGTTKMSLQEVLALDDPKSGWWVDSVHGMRVDERFGFDGKATESFTVEKHPYTLRRAWMLRPISDMLTRSLGVEPRFTTTFVPGANEDDPTLLELDGGAPTPTPVLFYWFNVSQPFGDRKTVRVTEPYDAPECFVSQASPCRWSNRVVIDKKRAEALAIPQSDGSRLLLLFEQVK